MYVYIYIYIYTYVPTTVPISDDAGECSRRHLCRLGNELITSYLAILYIEDGISGIPARYACTISDRSVYTLVFYKIDRSTPPCL